MFFEDSSAATVSAPKTWTAAPASPYQAYCVFATSSYRDGEQLILAGSSSTCAPPGTKPSAARVRAFAGWARKAIRDIGNRCASEPPVARLRCVEQVSGPEQLAGVEAGDVLLGRNGVETASFLRRSGRSLSGRSRWYGRAPGSCPLSRPRDAAPGAAQAAPRSDLRLLGPLDCVVDLDSEAPHCRLDLRVAKQQLDSPMILRAAIHQRRLSAPHRVGTVAGPVEAKLIDPATEDASVPPHPDLGPGHESGQESDHESGPPSRRRASSKPLETGRPRSVTESGQAFSQRADALPPRARCRRRRRRAAGTAGVDARCGSRTAAESGTQMA